MQIHFKDIIIVWEFPETPSRFDISPIHGPEPGWQNKSHFKPLTTCKFFFQFTSASKTILYTYNQSSNSHSMCCHCKWPHCPIFSPIIVYLPATKTILLLRSCSNVPQNLAVIFTDFFFLIGDKWIDLSWNRSLPIFHKNQILNSSHLSSHVPSTCPCIIWQAILDYLHEKYNTFNFIYACFPSNKYLAQLVKQ